MASRMLFGPFLFCLPYFVFGLSCNLFSPTYQEGAVPPHTGSRGPFGVVCEVRVGDPLPEPPSVPESLGSKAFVVRSSFPSHFMEESTVEVHRRSTSVAQPTAKPQVFVAHAGSEAQLGATSTRIGCGDEMFVSSVGDAMDEKVMGIKGQTGSWFGKCVACGSYLEDRALLKRGWFCEVGRAVGIRTGVWLKRDADKLKASEVKVLLVPGHEILGFGGAFTDATAVANDHLNPSLRSSWIEAYFGPRGAGYTVGRVPFGGADFSRRAYSLDDGDADLDLKRMCLRDDREDAKCGEDAKLQLIKDALHKESRLKLFFSPWSAPAWMKTSGKLAGGEVRGLGKAASADDKRIAQAWAQSYIKFVDLMAAEGIKFWGLTLQNEPGADQFVSWNANSLSGDQERTLLGMLGPLMRKSYPDMKIMVHDDQIYALKPRLLDQGNGILTSEFVDGIAYHWYGSFGAAVENTTAEYVVGPLPFGPKAYGGGIQVKEVFDAHVAGKDKFMLATEACAGYLDSRLHALRDAQSESNNRGVRPGDWYRGYRYSRDILYQLVNGASGWVDWNLLLLADGGPNWAGNNVDAPILTSEDGSALWISPMYFHMAHWAKYVVPGSRVLHVDTSTSELQEVAAFLRPDGKVVVVVLCDRLDGHGDPPASQAVRVVIGDLELQLDLLSSSIVTAVLDMPSSLTTFV
mmetsp:Transcript_56555/g.143074  ORF Transcript_56555/g.143074 Transcript_56555/m.143074 type:complete len:688 (+) Transcript_56555:65-2128(+)|eukprot:CAMPEP_0115234114 /NCGR_PEP_ID=MMETSP0270-20121206/34624_1 /TAXON_ID=71861 /ORGANISM="Scrippsiella trochoidea, Strain CCMP3099" /LENGTH=687 /DNA_ID=CAMNT_0002648847 /DNA_START=65 /DNA_END=2128 /DNA_ORIENTATION=-